MEVSTRTQRLQNELATGQGVLVIGPAFARGIESIDMNIIVESLADRLSDSSGWESLGLHDRIRLLAEGLGNEGLADILTDRMPSVEALRTECRAFHRSLLSAPFSTIIDLSLHDLVTATLFEINQRYRILTSDEDFVTQPEAFSGEKNIIKLRGDLWLGDAAFTQEELRVRLEKQRALTEFVRQQLREGPILFFGFSTRDPFLRFLRDFFAPLSGTSFLATRVDNHLWRRVWNGVGIDVIDAGTSGELEQKIKNLLNTFKNDDCLPDLGELIAESGDLTTRHLVGLKTLSWAHQDRVQLDALKVEECGPVRDAVRVLGHVAGRGLSIPSKPAAFAAEICLRIGDMAGARSALALAVQSMHQQQDFGAISAGSVGRTLNRMGDSDRARLYLRRAIQGDPKDLTERANDLAWLSRCVIEKIDRLRSRKRTRAMMELIANFLRDHAGYITLAQTDPGDNQDLERSIYYINLRLGRVMALAAQMAAASGDVYAQQATELLVRAIQLAPHKPDGYKALRPLLTDTSYATSDPKRWMALVAGAPPGVQRRLGGRSN